MYSPMRRTLKYLLLVALLGCFINDLLAQRPATNIAFHPAKPPSDRYYLVQHFQDKVIRVDSAIGNKGYIVFQNMKKKMPRGVYALLDKDGKVLTDFVVDDSQEFTIFADSTYSPKGMKVTGSAANQRMYDYLAHLNAANKEAKELKEQEKNGSKKEQKRAKERLEKLNKEMDTYQDDFLTANKKDLFCQLVTMSRNPAPPDSLSNDTTKAYYFRQHYWDDMDFTFPGLTLTPQLFNKMNYFFFGVLYYQDADTIIHYAFDILHRVENDSTMLRYFLDFILPRYQKATKHIGWDQVYVELVKEFYLKGKCPWASEANLYAKKKEVEFLEQSLIGAHAQELWMADTNQSDDPKDWISSHRFPTKYVILWFWDPDCGHCKKQTPELAELYNKMVAEGNKRFEVYAVGYEADVEKWKQYVRENKLPFVNVGGTNVNIDYQAAYNVHSTPTMIILNKDRDIIMNKTIPTDQINKFLDEYEKRHPSPSHEGGHHSSR